MAARRRRAGLPLAATLLAAAALAGGPAARAEDKPSFRIAFVGPLSGPLAASGEESLLGLRLAVERQNSLGGVGAKHLPAEVVALDDRDDPAIAAKALDEAVAGKCRVAVAASTGRTAPAVAAWARRGRKVPVLLCGSAGPAMSADREDPVAFLGPWPGDEALAAANALHLHAEKAYLGLHGDAAAPAFVVEDTPRGRELAAALRRLLGPRQKPGGEVLCPPGGAPDAAALKALRDARVDKVVVVGEPDLLDRTVLALAAARWEVPVFGMAGTLSRAAASLCDGRAERVSVLAGLPQILVGRPDRDRDQPLPRPLVRAHEAARGPHEPILPRTALGWLAGDLACTAGGSARSAKASDLVAALREVRYPADHGEGNMPLLDQVGHLALPQWFLWSTGKPAPTTAPDGSFQAPPETPWKGPHRVRPLLLPSGDIGWQTRLRGPGAYKAEPGTRVVWVTFGHEKSRQPRTIEKDMATLGIGTRGYEGNLDEWMLEEVLARTMGKLHRLFLRNYDGTPVPGVSWNISFTAEEPAGLKKSEYWTMVIAGEDPAVTTGGRAWPGEGRCEVYSTMLVRTLLAGDALKPPMSREDKTYLDGTYAWGTSAAGNIRYDALRALADGMADPFALTGAHELGHIAGLGHDTLDERSIMNVVGGAGLRMSNAWFIPGNQEVLDRVLGRHGEKKR